MAQRPVFIPSGKPPFTAIFQGEFIWNGGFAVSQKQKNIAALHQAFQRKYPGRQVLEISSKSTEPVGVALSAFNLKKFIPSLGIEVPLECAYQGGKIFAAGGPYTDLYTVRPKDAKRDERLRTSGALKSYFFEGQALPTRPMTAFYDWLYLNALLDHPNLAEPLLRYDGFTDIEFNPEKSLSTQARSAAMYVALARAGLLDKVRDYGEFIKLYTK